MKFNKKYFFAFLFFLIILSFLQFTIPYIIGFDGYFNIKSAELIREYGFFKEFPWAQNTIISQNYSNIQVLFHILLIPFTFVNLELGAKIATIIFGALFFLTLYWFLNYSKIKYPFFWTLLVLVAAETFMYRMMLPRQFPLIGILLLLTIFSLKEKKYYLLGFISFLWILLHSSFIIKLLIIIFYLIIEFVYHKKVYYKLLIFSVIGYVLGILINPYFPNNISLLITQIFKVNLIGNLYNVEWKAWPLVEFIKNNVVLLILFFSSLVIIIKNKKIKKNEIFYLGLTVLFFILTINSRRMQEYFIVFSILLFSLLINNYYKNINKKIKIGIVLLLVIIGVVNISILRTDIKNNSFYHNFNGCVSWMNNNIKDGSLVFNNAYTFPYLFFRNSDLRYTHGLDLTYSYLYDSETFERYMGILQGKLKSKEDFIISDYSPDYLFVGKIEQDVQLFTYIIDHKENYEAVYEDEWCAVLKVKV